MAEAAHLNSRGHGVRVASHVAVVVHRWRSYRDHGSYRDHASHVAVVAQLPRPRACSAVCNGPTSDEIASEIASDEVDGRAGRLST